MPEDLTLETVKTLLCSSTAAQERDQVQVTGLPSTCSLDFVQDIVIPHAGG